MGNNKYLVTQEIKSEAKVLKSIYITDLFFIVAVILIAYTFMDMVATPLRYPFLIFTVILSIILRLPSPYNRRRRIMDTLLIFLRRDTNIYYPVFFKEKKEKQGEIKQTALKEEKTAKKKVHKNFLDTNDIRRYDSEHKFILRKNGKYIDFYRIKTIDRANMSESDVQYEMAKFLKFLQTYAENIKITALNFPSNSQQQQAYFRKKIKQTKNPYQKKWLEISLYELEWIDQNTTKREYYLFYFGNTLDEMTTLKHNIINKLRIGQMGMLEEISQGKKEDIVFKLNNPSSIIRNPTYE